MQLDPRQGDQLLTRLPPRRSRSLNAFIVVIALALSALSWLAAVRQVSFEKEIAIRTATAQNDDRALMLQQYVSRTLGTADLATLHVAELHALGALETGTAEHPRIIESRIAKDPGFLGLSVVNEAGFVVATTLRSSGRTANVSGHPAFAVHKNADSGRLFVSKPGYAKLLRNHTIWLSRRLNHEDGRFAGVVAVNMAPAQLTAIFGQTAVKPSEVAWVAGTDGILRSRRTGERVSAGEDISHGQLFQAQRRSDRGNLTGLGALDGKMRLISHRRVAGQPLFVGYSIPEDEVLRGVHARARLLYFGAALVTAAALLIAALLLHALRQRERRALELIVSNARLEEAQRVAKLGDWSFSYHDGKVTWSPQLYEMYERDPALGPPVDELKSLISERSAQRMAASIEKLIETGAPASWEMDVRLPSGRMACHLVLAVPTRDERGAILGYHGTMQDVTERKKLEAMQDDLAHLSRVGAVNALAATLSHELNQPLAAASNFLSAGERLAAKIAEPVSA